MIPDEVIRFHEAAHAIVCLALGVRVKWIDCYVKDGLAHGEVSYWPAPADVDAVIALAGMVGEALRFGQSVPELTVEGHRPDGETVAQLSHEQQQAAATLAAAILRDNATAWETIAEALKDRPTLTAEDLEVTVRRG